MANPIRTIKRMEVPEEMLHDKHVVDMMHALVENKNAILRGIDLLSEIHSSGTLDAVHALVKQREVALTQLFTELNKERYRPFLENINGLLKLAGQLPIEDLQYLARKLNKGVEQAQKLKGDESVSYMGLVKALKDPEINRSLTTILAILKGMGKGN